MRHLIWLSLLLSHCTLLTNTLDKRCGDGFLQGDEQCDDGNIIDDDGCNSLCITEDSTCGDGTLDGSEACDDGNLSDNDACTNDCVVAFCGDGFVQTNVEECDDGNQNNNDGCDASCQDENDPCGDGNLDPNEECDDANQNNNDDCLSSCVFAFCGDGLLHNQESGIEECDDANQNNNDGCSSSCQDEDTLCGNGITNPGEDCDDGNLTDTDECKNNCSAPNILQVSAGTNHTCVLTEFGKIKCWGTAVNGQLGYGNNTNIGDNEEPSTVNLVSMGADISLIDAGGTHNCSITSNGSVLCWGSGAAGRLGYQNESNIGDNESPSTATPLDLGGNISAVSAGGNHTCALFSNGAVRCWGQNTFGQLGLGTNTAIGDNEPPTTNVDITGAPVISISTGTDHTCALLNSNRVRCWGQNNFGQLGKGNNAPFGDNLSETVQDTDIAFPELVDQLASGGNHNCVILAGGTLRCWGQNDSGQLGIGSLLIIGDDEVPNQPAISFASPIAKLALGDAHSCALLQDGTVRCWGRNNAGQLGRVNIANFGGLSGETADALSPIVLGEAATQITAGGDHTCALLSTGKVRCWGQALGGTLGYGNTSDIGDNEAPADAGDVPAF